jgi:hypothetical protein
MLDQTGKNTPSYFAPTVSDEEKSFVTLRTGVNVIKPFLLINDVEARNSGAFVPGKPFKPTFVYRLYSAPI